MYGSKEVAEAVALQKGENAETWRANPDCPNCPALRCDSDFDACGAVPRSSTDAKQCQNVECSLLRSPLCCDCF
eukprot:9449757-Alexandrium_andersonii.AAC.1